MSKIFTKDLFAFFHSVTPFIWCQLNFFIVTVIVRTTNITPRMFLLFNIYPIELLPVVKSFQSEDRLKAFLHHRIKKFYRHKR